MDFLSYSMLLDRKKKDEPFVDIDSRKIYKWVDDNAVTKCYSCNITFNFYYRKHHCRVCGRVFCVNCCYKYINVPNELQIKPDIVTTKDMVNNYIIKYINNGNNSDKVRVCNYCEKKVLEINNLKTLIKIFEIIKLDILNLINVRLVCNKWRKAANYSLSRIREIQYYLSDHEYNKYDKNMLWINRKYITGHSQWLIRLLKSIDYEDYCTMKDKLDEIVKIIESDKQKINCRKLMCGRQCNNNLSTEDCLNLLDKSIKSRMIKNFVIKYFDNENIQELTCYIPFLVHYMKYEVIEDSIIGKYLINKCINYSQPSNGNKIDGKKIIFINEFYWELRLGLEDDKYKSVYKYFLDKFDNEINENVVSLIKSGHNLINILKYPFGEISDRQIRNHINKNIKNYDKLVIPLNPIINDIILNIKNIHTKKSYTKPLYIPLTYKLNNELHNFNILYKYEDIRKDKIIMNLIKLIDIILKREENLDLNIVTYEIRPINSKSGFIEIVPECDTIYNIKEKLNFTILNYIMDNNKEQKIETVRKKFMKSCAAYCVITYILGIGDRHLDNIMITKSGMLFHIDYSYILGFDAKPITPNMRITSDMVDALGGINSEYYIEFKEICNKTYNCLRRHINLFLNMLTLLAEIDPPIDNKKNFTREMISNEILRRFVPGENNNDAELQLCNFIDNSSKNYAYMINDFFHYQNKDGIISNTMSASYDGAKNVIYNVYSYFS